jgi:hypothetical protein
LEELVALFERNGVLRLPNRKKRVKNPRTYKKGYEVRFVAHSEQELQRIRHLLRQAGFPVVASFKGPPLRPAVVRQATRRAVSRSPLSCAPQPQRVGGRSETRTCKSIQKLKVVNDHDTTLLKLLRSSGHNLPPRLASRLRAIDS